MDKLKELQLKWSQEGNLVYLHIKEDKFYFEAPNGYNIHEVDEDIKELALFHLFFNMGFFEKEDNYEQPSYIHKNITKPLSGKNIGLSFSNGCDSAAALLCLPPEKTVPIYCNRDYSKASSKKILSKLEKYSGNIKNHVHTAIKYNSNALKFMKKANIHNLQIINNDFELIRSYLLDNVSYGFNCGIGYASIIILLSKFFDIGYISFGAISESVFLGTGHRFIDVLDKHRPGGSLEMRWKRIYKAYGFKFFHALGGCSEIITSNIIKNSIFKNTACSCNSKISSDKNYCGDCIKCFRNFGMNGQMIPYKNNWGWVLYKFPLKMAASTIYSCQKGNYTNEFIEQYMHLDMSYLERYYGPYLDKEDDNQTALVPYEFRDYIQNKLKEYGIEPMNENDIKNFKNCGDYFNNNKYNNLNIKSKADVELLLSKKK